MKKAGTISTELAHFTVATDFEQLPRSTIETTKRCLLDALGVTLAAGRLGEGCGAFIDLAREQGGIQESSIIGFEGKVPAMMAAFANGSMAHALDFEDTHDGAILHPNAASIPAALALSEATGNVSGKKLITSLAVGCDIACRLGLALKIPLDDYGWYTPPILGAFGATAAAAHVLGLDARQTIDAYSLTLCQATCSAEIKYSPHSVIRAVRDAFSAKTGVLSAQLALKGVSGFELPFEGKAGFFSIFARNNYDPGILLEALGHHFEIDRISFKPWPTCRGTHIYIEAALELLRQHKLRAGEITNIHASGNRLLRMLMEPVQQKKQPATAIDAKFSIPFSVATAICHGRVALEHFTEESLRNERVLAIADRVDFTETKPGGNIARDIARGTLTIKTRDGQTFSMEMEQPYGHPDRPLKDDFLRSKFTHNTSFSAIGGDSARIEKIIDRVLALEQVQDVSTGLMSLL